MESNKTIIYYTANMEDPAFEQRIMDNIYIKSGGLPIISVSRKPINFGTNICVGEKPVCYANSFRQLLIGLKEAKTKFCIATESDVLYPAEYFQFTPPTEDNVYRYTNLYVYFAGYQRFWKKPYVEAAQMCGREFWIKSVEKVLEGQPEWGETSKLPLIFTTKTDYSWTSDKPVITFKTRKGIGYKTGFIHGAVSQVPYWGTVDEVKKFVNL